MKYSVNYNSPQNHFIDFKLEIDVKDKDEIKLQIPSWRPGRYELGNFAKNIKDFKILDPLESEVDFEKTSKDSWLVKTRLVGHLTVSYSYYAAELNAGSTFLNEDQLYINPVNCMMYVDGNSHVDYQIEFLIPKDYSIYSSLKKENKHLLKAKNFDELADSPIIASRSLQHKSIDISGVNFNFCFQGEIKVDWNRIFKDFEKFSTYQIKKFGSFPHKEFYFLFQITPFSAYHGVEHHKSTVILLGSSYNVFSKLYNELLGVSSHELYHVWNVKSIRPIEMHPYNFSEENYSQMGYVAEGVTTYMGDRVLFESGVFDKQDYFKELKTLLLRHFHNDGRNHYSVAESSWDTWLDGYVAGVPGRKVSIYVEGALIALICDAKIREVTNYDKTLHDVMKSLYSGSDLETNYDHSLYQSTLEKVSGFDFSLIFDELVFGVTDFTNYLKNAFRVFGWSFDAVESEKIIWRFGFKTLLKKDKLFVASVLEGSSAFISGLTKNDRIISVNGFVIEKDLEDWLNYFIGDQIVLQIERDQKLKEVKLLKYNTSQYYNYNVKEI